MARRMPLVTRLALLVAFVSAFALQDLTPVRGQSCGPRVRKAWGMLSTTEKQLYLDAVMTAMADGNHTLFLEVHGDTASGNEAHRTCGMIYWHRRFILAYENMLRSLAPRFACVTIPYWDYYTDYTKRLTGQCTTFETCSRILSEFGGSIGPANTNAFDATPLTGSCVDGSQVPASLGLETNFSLSGFCQNSALSSCWGCVPRDNWAAKAFPSGFSLGTLARLISGSFGFAVFAQNLHYGVHNSIHNTAGSTMATLWTSADPIFYNHHSTIDLVHQWWYDCQVKRPMTEYEKKNSLYAFQQCALSITDVCPTVLANITQFWSNGTARVRVEDHPVLGQYFGPLPTQYWQYVSGTDLGDYSYSYEKDSLLTAFSLANISIGCPLVSKARRLADLTESFALAEPLPPAPQTSLNLFKDLVDTSLAKVQELQPTLAASERQTEAFDQVELMHCSWYQEMQGFVDDYTPYFRTNLRLPWTAHTPCYNRVQQLRTGQKSIAVTNWRDIFTSHLVSYTGNAFVSPRRE